MVTFDTTYRTNLYNLPFGIFVGVNNHYQTIIFGGVLLTQETKEDFEWTFKSFIEIMSGKHPETILTGEVFKASHIIFCVCVLLSFSRFNVHFEKYIL